MHRRVPGDDGAHHADRLAPRVAEHVLAERDGLALELAGEPAEVAEDVGGAPGLGPRLGADGVAGLLGDDARQLLDARLDRVGDPLQDAPALARHHPAPGREGGGRGLDRAVDVLGAAARHAGDGAPRAGGLDGDAPPEAASTQAPSISICTRLTSPWPGRPLLALLTATAITVPPVSRGAAAPTAAPVAGNLSHASAGEPGPPGGAA